MPHFPKPFFRPKKGRWYVQLDGKHVNLGPDEGEAFRRYRALMAERDRKAPAAPEPDYPFVAVVIDEFTAWLRGRVADGTKARRTLRWYERYLASFLRHLRSLETPPPADPGEAPALRVDRLTPALVYSWVDRQAGWKTGKRGAMIAVSRAFNWAAKAGLLKSLGGRSPLAGLEKPPQGRREKLVSPEEYAEVLAIVKDQEFRDLLELSWETGARPHELFTVEAAFVDAQTACWTFPVKLSKGKKVQRVVYLSDRALEITRRLVALRPSGPLLLNTEGRPWCVSSVKCRFQKICRTIGRKRLEQSGQVPPKLKRLTAAQRADPGLRARHEEDVLGRRRRVNDLARQQGVRLNLYAFRHSLITESLVRGLDAVTVSVLAGHRDTTMISRHYAHLAQRHEHLRDAARKARGA